MKAKWTSIVGEMQGNIDARHYARHIPGSNEWGAVCSKPELSAKTKKKKAALPVVQNFRTMIATCKAILHDSEQRALWQARYDEGKRQASKHNKEFPARLCDYVRREVSVALKQGESGLSIH